MKHLCVAGLILFAGACEAAPVTLQEAAAAHDWQNESGASLQRAFATDVKRAVSTTSRATALEAIKTAGYECTYGEGHEDYPEPAAVCTRSFATRACQMDWEIMLTSDPKKPDSVDELSGDFKRDCVGVDRDFPEPVRSAIDDQLAPMKPPL
jgi:hypothetical protein